MKRHVHSFAVLAALTLAAPEPPGTLAAAATPSAPASPAASATSAPPAAPAVPAARQKLAALQFLVGTWSCTHTVGTFSGTYTTTYANALGNLWLEQTYDFPPHQVGENPEAVQGKFFIGYDERRQAWVRFGAMGTGDYFANRMTAEGDGVWAWKYVSFFPRKTPETPGSDATFTRKSDTEYEVSGPSYEQKGARVTEHHVCRKL